MGWESWLDLALPRHCRGCGRVGELWCPSCTRRLAALRPGLLPPPAGVAAVFAAAGTHEGLLRSAILTHKHDRNQAVRAALVPLLGRALAAVAEVLRTMGQWRTPVLVVPVPPSAHRPWRRPVAELTAPLCGGLPAAQQAPLLVSARRRRPQKGLDAAARARNVAGAWRVSHTVGAQSGGTVIVADDVVTTGATLAAAFTTLAQAGFRPAAAIALARADAVGR